MPGFKSLCRKIKSTKFWILFSFFALPACGEGPPEVAVKVDKQFRTTPPSRIYFNNIRKVAYQWEQDPVSRTDFYLLRKIGRSSSKPALYPVIADIWMEDQAQVLLRSDLYDTLPLPILVHWQTKQDSGSYIMNRLTAHEMYDLSMNIYRSLQRSHTLEVSFPDTGRIPLLRYSVDRTNFLTSMQDYLRLTEFRE